MKTGAEAAKTKEQEGMEAPSMLKDKDIPASKMQQEAFKEVEEETVGEEKEMVGEKAKEPVSDLLPAEDKQVSSTGELEKMYLKEMEKPEDAKIAELPADKQFEEPVLVEDQAAVTFAGENAPVQDDNKE